MLAAVEGAASLHTEKVWYKGYKDSKNIICVSVTLYALTHVTSQFISNNIHYHLWIFTMNNQILSVLQV